MWLSKRDRELKRIEKNIKQDERHKEHIADRYMCNQYKKYKEMRDRYGEDFVSISDEVCMSKAQYEKLIEDIADKISKKNNQVKI